MRLSYPVKGAAVAAAVLLISFLLFGAALLRVLPAELVMEHNAGACRRWSAPALQCALPAPVAHFFA